MARRSWSLAGAISTVLAQGAPWSASTRRRAASAIRSCRVTAVGLAGIGSGALIVAGLGAGTGELFGRRSLSTTGQAESPVRFVFVFELSWLVIGVVLGGPVGFGAIYVAVLVGLAVMLGQRVGDRSATALRRRIVASIPQRAEIGPTADETSVLVGTGSASPC